MSANYYAKIERGELKPSVDIYVRIAKALKVRATDIFPLVQRFLSHSNV